MNGSELSKPSKPPRPLLGCIADDMTGATDLANNLVQAGMRVVQWFGDASESTLAETEPVVKFPLEIPETDAIVVALKTRSLPVAEAVEQSVASLSALRGLGCQRFFFKYCSTFDSTPQGNIGPVAEALMDALGVSQTIYCVAFPRAGRTVYRGHLFVHNQLLNQSGMEKHPLNPMDDANLVRVLQQQTTRPVGRVGYDELISPHRVVQVIATASEQGVEHLIMDACDNSHLRTIAEAVADLPLVTGSSGLATYLPSVYRRSGLLSDEATTARLPEIRGRSLILSGSCSVATNRQVNAALDRCWAWPIDVPKLVADPQKVRQQLWQWAQGCDAERPLLVYATCSPEQVQRIQQALGAVLAASAVEQFLGWAAHELVERLEIRRVIVAGGETSGAVIKRLGIKALRIGPEICTGVPWTESIGQPAIALALKSGNFGDDDFFQTALEMLP